MLSGELVLTGDVVGVCSGREHRWILSIQCDGESGMLLAASQRLLRWHSQAENAVNRSHAKASMRESIIRIRFDRFLVPLQGDGQSFGEVQICPATAKLIVVCGKIVRWLPAKLLHGDAVELSRNCSCDGPYHVILNG